MAIVARVDTMDIFFNMANTPKIVSSHILQISGLIGHVSQTAIRLRVNMAANSTSMLTPVAHEISL
jgi:hypothetical protein